MANDQPDWTSPGQSVLVLTHSENASSSSSTFNLPAGTQSLIIETVVQAGDRSDLSLTGATTSFPYYSQGFGGSAYEIIGVQSIADGVINFTAQSHNGPGVTWTITASPLPPPTFITRQPAPWQVPTLAKTLNQGIPHGSFFTWIPAVANQRIRLFDMYIMWDTSTAGFGRFAGSAATGTVQQYDQKATNFIHRNFGGFALAVGEAFAIFNDDIGNGQNMNGGILYSLD